MPRVVVVGAPTDSTEPTRETSNPAGAGPASRYAYRAAPSAPAGAVVYAARSTRVLDACGTSSTDGVNVGGCSSRASTMIGKVSVASCTVGSDSGPSATCTVSDAGPA